ncbi:tyrosine recombinase XerC [Brucella sp. NBRC 12953]
MMDANNRNHRFLDPGPLSSWIDRFAEELAAQRYAPLTIEGYTASARHFAAWLCKAGTSIDVIDDNIVRSFAEHRCRCPGGRQWPQISPKYSRRVGRFVFFLQRAGVVCPPLKIASPYPLLDGYQSWLRIHRGLAERTIARHLRDLHKLLPLLGTATLDYDASLIRDVVREWRERTGTADLRTITSALRSYLRYLAGAGLCRPNLDHAIPPVLQWRLSSLPRYLAGADVERVIASCDRLAKGRLRDRALLLLLARLGLRAGCAFRSCLHDRGAGAKTCGHFRSSVVWRALAAPLRGNLNAPFGRHTRSYWRGVAPPFARYDRTLR